MRSAVFMELNNYAVCEREWAVLLSYVAAVTWVIDRDFYVVSIKSIIMLDCFDTTFLSKWPYGHSTFSRPSSTARLRELRSMPQGS